MSDVDDLVEAMAKAMSRRIMVEETGISLGAADSEALNRAVDRHWPQCEKDARAALAAIEPTGKWRIVPVEPTEEMRRAASGRRFEDGWYALLDAAPKVTPSDTP